MINEQALVAFEKHKIRRFYDQANELWYFSVIDVVSALTDSVNPRDYWFKMKIRVKTEDGLELSTICRQLKIKMMAEAIPFVIKPTRRNNRIPILQAKD